MLKYTLLLLGLVGCAEAPKVKLYPKFHKRDHVYYRVPGFYLKVCSGAGIVDGYRIENDAPPFIVYEIETEAGCPTMFIQEKDVQGANS